MATRLQVRTTLAVACVAPAAVCGVARADDVPLVTGKQWTESREQVNRAYLIGIANIHVDRAYQVCDEAHGGRKK